MWHKKRYWYEMHKVTAGPKQIEKINKKPTNNKN
jgi:hypothetical protein